MKKEQISNSETAKVKAALNFFEELSWLIESNKKYRIDEFSAVLKKKFNESSAYDGVASKYVSPNPNIHYLIGVLPRFLQDISLFEKNEDISNFAKEVLGIDVTRPEKRSKYEMIGLIVCQTNELNDEKLNDLVNSLANIVGSTEKLKKIANEKKVIGFSWNEAIRTISRSEKND